MGTRSEGTLSKAGLAALGVLSVVGFLPVLASSSVVIGVQSSAGADAPLEAAAPAPSHPASDLAPEHHAIAIAVLEPEPSPPPAPPAPAPVEAPPEPAPAPAEPAPEPSPPTAPVPEPSVELAAVTPADPPPSGLAGLGSGLTTAAAPATAIVPVPLVDGVVTPLLGSLLGGR